MIPASEIDSLLVSHSLLERIKNNGENRCVNADQRLAVSSRTGQMRSVNEWEHRLFLVIEESDECREERMQRVVLIN